MPTDIERLYREHRAGLVRLVERELHDHHDAEDVVQTAFLDAQRALERGTIPRDPSAWLAAIALNAGRRLRRRRLSAEPLEEYAVHEASAMSEIRTALASLPREQRAAVLYRDLLGLTYGETAEQMDRSVDAVTMLLYRGRQRLRQTLGAIAGGVGLWRWLKKAGMPQVAVVKGAGAVVVAGGLATAGIVAAREVAPLGTQMTAASAPSTRSADPTAGAERMPLNALMHDSARRLSRTTEHSRPGATPASTPPPGRGAMQGAAAPSTAAAVGSSAPTSMLRLPSLPVRKVRIPTLPVTVAATVTVTTPVISATVTVPTGLTATTPLTTVTLPLP